MKHGCSWKRLVMTVAITVSSGLCAGGGLLAVPERPQAEDFSLLAPDGSRHQLSDYRGEYVLVNFWAGWCTPCIRELPSLQRIYAALVNRNFVILAIHAGPETPDMRDLLQRIAVSFPVLVDTDLALVNWHVDSLPSSFLLDPEGRVVYRATGAIDWDEPGQRSQLEQLLNQDIDAAGGKSGPALTM